MRISDIKGEQAFKVMGEIIDLLREMFSDKKVIKVVNEKKQGWILEFFSVSLKERSDLWMKMYLTLNPDVKKDDVSLGSVIKFAYEFKNDPELMSLFFSQSEQTETNSSGSHTVTIEEIGK